MSGWSARRELRSRGEGKRAVRGPPCEITRERHEDRYSQNHRPPRNNSNFEKNWRFFLKIKNGRGRGGWLTNNRDEPANGSCGNHFRSLSARVSQGSILHLSCFVIIEANFRVEFQNSARSGVDYASKFCARFPELLRGGGNLIPKAFDQNI